VGPYIEIPWVPSLKSDSPRLARKPRPVRHGLDIAPGEAGAERAYYAHVGLEARSHDAPGTNDSAVKVLGEPTLRGIARELVASVRANVTIDWTVRELERTANNRLKTDAGSPCGTRTV
jgi:hypothetical protein